MNPWPRIAMSLYVAIAVHAVVLLGLGLVLPGQVSSGAGQRLSLGDSSEAVEQLLSSVPKHLWQRPAAQNDDHEAVAQESSFLREPSVEATPQVDGTGAVSRHPVETAAPPDRFSNAPAERASAAEGSSLTAMVAAGGRSGTDTYFTRLQRHLAAKGRSMPLEWSGAEVLVGMRLGRNGMATDLRIAKTSGIPEMDREVLSWFVRAQPFPSPPADATGPLLIPIGAGQDP